MLRFLSALILSAALALPVGGCSTVDTFRTAVNVATSVKVTKTQAYVAANAFLAVKASATNYIDLPICKAGETFVPDGCSRRFVIDKIVPVIRVGTQNRKDLIAYVRTNPDTIGASGLYTAVTEAAKTLRAALDAEGFKS